MGSNHSSDGGGASATDYCTTDLCKSVMISTYAYSDDTPKAFRLITKSGVSWSSVRKGFSKWTFVSNKTTDAQAVCAYEAGANRCWVAFRGTESLADAAADIRVSKAAPSFCRGVRGAEDVLVHRGFLRQFDSIRKPVAAFLDKHPSCDQIVFTGHSLGGALAVMGTLYARAALSDRSVKCITFGCPRVGNGSMRDFLEGTAIKRVELGMDPVAAIPSRARWVHAGRGVRLCATRPPSCTATGVIDTVWNVFRLPSPFRVGDHDLKGYCNAVTWYWSR